MMFFVILFTIFMQAQAIMHAADEAVVGATSGDADLTTPSHSTFGPLPATSQLMDTLDGFLALIQNPFLLNQPLVPAYADPDVKKTTRRKEKRKLGATPEADIDDTNPISVPLPIAVIQAEDFPIWLKTQLYLQNRAQAYQEQRTHVQVYLKEDLDLWSLLVFRGINQRNEYNKPLEWIAQQIKANGSGLEGAIGQLDNELREYETNIELFRTRNPYNENENEEAFIMWFSMLPQRTDNEMSEEKLQKWFKKFKKTLNKTPFHQSIFLNLTQESLKQKLHRKWLSALPADTDEHSAIQSAIAKAMHLEIQKYKLIQLQERLEDFYKKQVDALPPITAESIVNFALQPLNLENHHLIKFMEGKYETNEGVEERPISEEEITGIIEFIRNHCGNAEQYITDAIL